MTSSAIASAFVKSYAVRQVIREAAPALVSQRVDVGIPIATGQLSTALYGVNPAIGAACLNFFDSIKTPSTLIAGASLTALFTFTTSARETYNYSKLQVMLLRVYHMFSLLSFCFSLMTVLTAQAATTSLLLDNKHLLKAGKKNLDAFTFLRASMNFEFLLTRWTFFMSILSYFLSTTFRLFVEFGLFSPTRRLAGTMVSSMMAGVFCFVVSFVNSIHAGLPGLWPTTKEVATLVWQRAYVARLPLQIASMAFLGIALLCSLRFLFPGSIEYDQFLDTERYT